VMSDPLITRGPRNIITRFFTKVSFLQNR